MDFYVDVRWAAAGGLGWGRGCDGEARTGGRGAEGDGASQGQEHQQQQKGTPKQRHRQENVFHCLCPLKKN